MVQKELHHCRSPDATTDPRFSSEYPCPTRATDAYVVDQPLCGELREILLGFAASVSSVSGSSATWLSWILR